MEVKARLINIFADLFNLEINTSIEKINTNDIEDWDSLNHLNVIIAIENEFDINIPPEDFPKLHNECKIILKYIEVKERL